MKYKQIDGYRDRVNGKLGTAIFDQAGFPYSIPSFSSL